MKQDILCDIKLQTVQEYDILFRTIWLFYDVYLHGLYFNIYFFSNIQQRFNDKKIQTSIANTFTFTTQTSNQPI